MLKGDGKYSALQKNRILPTTPKLSGSTLLSLSSAAYVEKTRIFEGGKELGSHGWLGFFAGDSL